MCCDKRENKAKNKLPIVTYKEILTLRLEFFKQKMILSKEEATKIERKSTDDSFHWKIEILFYYFERIMFL